MTKEQAFVPVHQDDREEAARLVEGDQFAVACNIRAGHMDDFRIVQAFARHRTAAIAGAQSGYSMAFYELAKLMGIGARPAAPGHVWRSEMLPRLIRALAADAASYADTLNLENARG